MPACSPAAAEAPILTRPVPRTGEALPRIGLGSWQTLDVDPDDAEAMAPLAEVMERFFALGGTLIDSSPMYGRSEAVIGRLVGERPDDAVFRATKVWTRGREQGIREMTRSEHRMGGPVDLMQIHNLVDWRTHLETLSAWKAAGRIRYIGVTHYQLSALDELASIAASGVVDFVQLPYSVVTRDAEARLLPACRDAGVAVLVMRPFEGGELFRRVKGRPLPAWAAELEATSWGQLFLKWILGHPAVTAPIPATSRLKHLVDNMGAGTGPLPDEALRARIAAAIG